MAKLSDNIWFTRKARIQASERLLVNDRHSQFLLVIYSIINTCLAVILIKDNTMLGGNTDLALVIMSIVILVTSLYVTSKNFKGRAESLKNHYIELQKLYYNALDAEEASDKGEIRDLREQYTELLELSENHRPIDDRVFRVSKNKNLDTRKPSKYDFFVAYAYMILKFLMLVVFYLSPFLVIYLITQI